MTFWSKEVNSAAPAMSRAGLAALTLLWLPGGGDAWAAFKVCNQSIALYNIAVGAEINQKFNTEGWWTLPANSCVTPIKEDLTDLKIRYIYLYATTVTGESAFEGEWDMCVDTKRFKIPKIPGESWNCWVRGFQAAKFQEINTGDAKSWTVFVRGGTK